MTDETKSEIYNEPFTKLGQITAELWNLETFGRLKDPPITDLEQRKRAFIGAAVLHLADYCNTKSISIVKILEECFSLTEDPK